MIDNIFTTFKSLKIMDATDADQLKENFEKLLAMELRTQEEVLALQERRDMNISLKK